MVRWTFTGQATKLLLGRRIWVRRTRRLIQRTGDIGAANRIPAALSTLATPAPLSTSGATPSGTVHGFGRRQPVMSAPLFLARHISTSPSALTLDSPACCTKTRIVSRKVAKDPSAIQDQMSSWDPHSWAGRGRRQIRHSRLTNAYRSEWNWFRRVLEVEGG